MLQQHLPFTVLKLAPPALIQGIIRVATAPTVYGIETNHVRNHQVLYLPMLQQYLPFTVCAAECEATAERSDDEAHTLQVPERSEGKTKVIRQ